jgi:predicted CXXCH cytochrome family protein
VQRLPGGLTGQTAGHCAACHAPGSDLARLSPAHRQAAALYHRDAALLDGTSPSQGCLNCHAAGSGSPWVREVSDRNLTFNPHATHPLGVDVVPGSGQDERRLRAVLDPKLRLFDGRLECQTCHNLTAATEDLLVPFPQPYDLCLGCHKLSNPKPSTERRELLATMVEWERP